MVGRSDAGPPVFRTGGGFRHDCYQLPVRATYELFARTAPTVMGGLDPAMTVGAVRAGWGGARQHVKV